MARCDARHPEHETVTCVYPPESNHDLHGGFLAGEPVAWPNPDYVPPAPERVKKILDGVRKARERPVDANVIDISADHPDTSIEMKRRAIGRSGENRRTIYDHLIRCGEHGATDKEMQEALEMEHESQSGTRRGLVKDGWVDDSGVRRPTPKGNPAIVWIALS